MSQAQYLLAAFRSLIEARSPIEDRDDQSLAFRTTSQIENKPSSLNRALVKSTDYLYVVAQMSE